ncbi:MAG TPA: alpha/beta hydrolase [Thermodesulfobacteriaceae bacterium]|nr:alpha/beta hydrolase [Thermodesulfobacteriaceae bacterium]
MGFGLYQQYVDCSKKQEFCSGTRLTRTNTSDMEFCFRSRQFRQSLVLLPGWGFLPAIFSRLDLPFNYIVPSGQISGNISDHLLRFMLENGLERVNILGWSMGGVAAIDFFTSHPELVNAMYLVSLRRSFSGEEIDAQVRAVESDRDGALRNFYRRCFAGHKEDYRWFEGTVEGAMTEGISTEKLIEGLEYLRMNPVDLAGIPEPEGGLQVFHGTRDLIAPLEEMPALLAGVNLTLIRGAGHVPFFSREFVRLFRVH